VVDAGEWDGEGELSSGIIFSFGQPAYQYKVTFMTAGTYNYLCLIHPGMLGSVTVE
jgi:plastocyanin